MRITVHVPDDIGAEAERVAREQGVSVSSLYAEAVELHLREVKRQRAFAAITGIIGQTPVAPVAADFGKQLAALRRDDPERV